MKKLGKQTVVNRLCLSALGFIMLKRFDMVGKTASTTMESVQRVKLLYGKNASTI